jgi:hypothetical protein
LHEVEPSRTPGSAGGDADLFPDALQLVSNIVELLRGEWAASDPRGALPLSTTRQEAKTYYALTTPMTSLIDCQPMLTPARIPPTEQFDDVTKG